MTDIPAIFSGPMVRALLDGRKTKTRRLAYRKLKERTLSEAELKALERRGWEAIDGADDITTIGLRSPWLDAKPGDRLWVRETWRPGAWRERAVACDYLASPEENRTPWCAIPDAVWADLEPRLAKEAEAAALAGRGSVRRVPGGKGWAWERGDSPCRWRPSIHMPRWASRLTLLVTAVRQEPLQAITPDDIRAEGLRPATIAQHGTGADEDLQSQWEELWDTLHGEGAWRADPEVAVISFEVRHANIDRLEG